LQEVEDGDEEEEMKTRKPNDASLEDCASFYLL
jgi:hypothetical protein